MSCSTSRPSNSFLTLLKEYEVYAVSVYDGITFLQLVDDKETPTFFPRVFFDVIDTVMPDDWICNVFPTGPVHLILGPSFIAKDLASLNGMVESSREQTREFWKRIDAARRIEDAE
jgi:hypothetical protein